MVSFLYSMSKKNTIFFKCSDFLYCYRGKNSEVVVHRCSIDQLSCSEKFSSIHRIHLLWRQLFSKVAGLGLQLQLDLTQVFSCVFCSIFQNSFSKKHLWMMLLTNSGINFSHASYSTSIHLMLSDTSRKFEKIKKCNDLLFFNRGIQVFG